MAVYSAIATLLPLLIVASALCAPSHKLDKTNSLAEFKIELARLKPKLRRRHYTAGIIFLIIGTFCSLYLVGFGQLAGPEVGKEWVISVSISLAVDLIIFEMLPAVMVAGSGVLAAQCHSECLLSVVVGVELYRFIKNVVDT